MNPKPQDLRQRTVAPATIGALARLTGLLSAWALLFLSSPGLFRPLGFGHIAFVALVPWALVAHRPGRLAKTSEWFAAALGLAAFSYWLWPVLPGIIPAIGVVTALYPVLAGVVLRRLARAFPLSLAVPLAWLAGELPRFLLPVPFSFGWWRLGTMAHHTSWLIGSSRFWGVFGLSYVFAAFSGLLADAIQRYRSAPGARLPALSSSLAFGLTPLGLALLLNYGTSAPALKNGPSVLLVQPGLEQDRKNAPENPLREIFGDACALTREALDELAQAGAAAPDLVAWGETMLYVPVVEAGFAEAVARGAQPPDWTGETMSELRARALQSQERAFVGGLIFGQAAERVRLSNSALTTLAAPWLERVLAGEALLPQGTSFFSGAVLYTIHAGQVRRKNAGVLWDGNGERSGSAAKVNLVPGAEDLRGTQAFPPIVRWMNEIGGYIPDFVPAENAQTLTLSTRAGESYRMAVSICYDNAFDAPYAYPARSSALDFHLVASNEAWYRESVEMDHMLAFSRLMAAATGRSIVRATNSGISAVIDPQGREIASLSRGGQRRMVRGSLLVTVPVPDRMVGESASPTLFARSSSYQWMVWAAAILLALVWAHFRPVT